MTELCINCELTKYIFYSRWSATSRVDLSIFGPEIKYIFGRGKNRLNDPLPEQRFILQDGSAGTFITNFSENPDRYAKHTKKLIVLFAPQIVKTSKVSKLNLTVPNQDACEQ